jgi:hypothetical protein
MKSLANDRRTSHIRRLSVALSFALLSSCGAADSDWPSEVVSPPESDELVRAMVRDGDVIYVGRRSRLDRIDIQTGHVVKIAGPEWSQCPVDPYSNWRGVRVVGPPTPFAVRGTTFYLASDDDCGLWSFEATTGKSRMLVDRSAKARGAIRAGGEIRKWTGALWNGKSGPHWDRYGMAVATDGDGLLGCFDVSGEDYGDSSHVELWSIGPDGEPREQLASVPPGQAKECTRVIPDAETILLATDRSLLRWDRRTRTLSTIARTARYAPAGVEQDATGVYFGMDNSIMWVPRSGGEPVVLIASSGELTEWARSVVGIDADHVYFHEGDRLKRVKRDGSNLMEFAVAPGYDFITSNVAITPQHVYFVNVTRGVPGGQTGLATSLHRKRK